MCTSDIRVREICKDQNKTMNKIMYSSAIYHTFRYIKQPNSLLIYMYTFL